MLRVPGYGDPKSRIWIVGEAPGEDEEILGVPFVGTSGKILDSILAEVGIERRECYVTNVSKYRPPGNEMDKWLERRKSEKTVGGWKYKVHHLVEDGKRELLDEVERYRPEIIIGLGNTALWALAGEWGISNWRGSELLLEGGIHFVPTLHPAAVARSWDLRPFLVHDLRYRVVRRLKCGFHVPTYRFNTNPTYDEAMGFIEKIKEPFAGDIESSRLKTVCLGIAPSPYEAICIPIRNYQGAYWTDEEFRDIYNAFVSKAGKYGLVGQNWGYDRQYLHHDFGGDVKPAFDTYIAQSVLFPGAPRDLGFLSSMYCEHHVFWKEEAKDWNNIKDFPKLFRYNCKDVCATLESSQVLRELLIGSGLWDQFEDRMQYGENVFRMMMRGVQRDEQRTDAMIAEVEKAIEDREAFITEKNGGEPVNFQSSKQVGEFLFKKMGFKSAGKTKSGAASTKDEVLQKLVEKSPEAGEVCTPILEARSLANLQANFLGAELDPDGRFRASWSPTGTETFRLTSSGNAYHRGGPLQNITDGKHTHSGRRLPNLRSTIVPPSGYLYWNCDLERADVQVVAWEADDESLKKMLRDGVDIHLVNAVELFNIPGVPYEECMESHPNYLEHKERHEQKRHFAKTFVHLTNYGGKERTAAIKTHTTVAESGKLQRRWFQIHPGIKRWHDRTETQLRATRTVRNKFGFRRVYFDRIESSFTEALAWVPQSTVSLVISKVHMEMETQLLPGYEKDWWVELQGHDSLSGCISKDSTGIILPVMHAASKRVVVPYDDPLVIPLELALSDSSWGEVRKEKWPT